MTIQWPSERIPAGVGGVTDPLFITDIINANQSLKEGMLALFGYPIPGTDVDIPDMIILSGVKNNGIGGYGPGIIYALGNFYYLEDAVIFSGKYINPQETEVFEVRDSDGNYRASYKRYTIISSNTSVSGLPEFTGDMDAYRLNFNFLNASNLHTGKVPLGRLPQITIESGDWNMNTTTSISIPLTDFGLENSSIGANKVKGIEVMVRSDDNGTVLPLNYIASSDFSANGTFKILNDGIGGWNLHCYRRTGGEFDSVNYQATSYNRASITLDIIE